MDDNEEMADILYDDLRVGEYWRVQTSTKMKFMSHDNNLLKFPNSCDQR